MSDLLPDLSVKCPVCMVVHPIRETRSKPLDGPNTCSVLCPTDGHNLGIVTVAREGEKVSVYYTLFYLVRVALNGIIETA